MKTTKRLVGIVMLLACAALVVTAAMGGGESIGKLSVQVVDWFSDIKGTLAILVALAGVFFLGRHYSRKVDSGRLAKKNIRISAKYVMAGIAVVCLVFGWFAMKELKVGPWGEHNESSRAAASSSQVTVTDSDIIGRWVGQYEGLTAMDITFLPGGSFIGSAGDFAGGRSSKGRWHISNGNTLVIDYGDGGENLLFSFKNGQLVAMNGRTLNRK